MDRLNSGDVLELISTDPGSKNDFKAWVRTAGHELIDVHEADGVYTIYVKKK